MAELEVKSPSGASGAAPPPSAPATTTLENGGRLTRCEFERRYALRPDLKKAQLIERIVFMPSPVRVAHAEPHAMNQAALLVYAASTPGVHGYDNATLRLDLDNEPQPDALLRLAPEAGGRSRVSADGYLEGAPELNRRDRGHQRVARPARQAARLPPQRGASATGRSTLGTARANLSPSSTPPHRGRSSQARTR